MATLQTINIGNIVNDGLGDDLRTAFQKVNANFTSLNAALTVTASNIGAVGEGIFNRKDGVNLEFKKLVAGNKITITSTPDTLVIASTEGQAFRRITTQDGFVDSNSYQFVTFQGDPDISVSAYEDVVTIGTRLDLNTILKITDFGPIDGTFDNNVQLSLAASNIDFGTFANSSDFNLDQGTFSGEAENPILNPLLFRVTNNGSAAYFLDEVSNPTITLIRGNTYTFDMNVVGHPFWIKTERVSGVGSVYTSGVVNNGATTGEISFTVPADAPNTLYYVCQFHITMSGQINITPVIDLGDGGGGGPSA